MSHHRILRTLAALAAVLVLVLPGTGARAETLVGTDIESRIILGLSAPADAVQEKLPEGWSSVPFPRGPLKGANILVSFIDGHLMLGDDGKPLDPASRRAVTLVGLGKEDGGDAVRIFVMGIYTTATASDPYGLNVKADVARDSVLGGPGAGPRHSTESWTVVPETGGELMLALDFTTGRRGWSASEAFSYSAANPDFYRIYRYDSITDVVMSAAMGKEVDGAATLQSSVPELAGIFDGSEKLLAILDVPVRVREAYLP